MLGCLCKTIQLLLMLVNSEWHCYNEAGESLHDGNAINAIKIAVSDIVARVRYHTEDTLMYVIMCTNFTFLFQSSKP